jgi:hypothetical protein
MKSEMSSESPQSGSHAHAFDQLDESALAYVRAVLIEEGVQSGFSRVSAENLIDFMWAARGWPLVCEEQWRNIRRWSLN